MRSTKTINMMSASSKVSLIKRSSNSTTQDSSQEEEHDWTVYLIETNSEAAPANHFRQSLNPPINEFNVGEKLESIDPRNQDSWCIGTIVEKDGPRLRIRLDGTDDRNDFWRLVDSGDIRCYGTTAKQGGQIVPPLGFQLNSTRWAKYFERNVKDGPFSSESCFKTPPPKPEKNLFKKGQKLEAVDPRHPHIICPATISNVIPGDYRIMISLDGWSSLNDFKVDYSSRDIFPVGWCQLTGIRIAKVGGNPYFRTLHKSLTTIPNNETGKFQCQKSKINKTNMSTTSSKETFNSSTRMDEKNNNIIYKRKMNETPKIKKVFRSSTDINETNINIEDKQPIVTVYFNYLGDNSGMLLNPQKFRTSMLSIFGPDEYHIVLTSIFNSCLKCAFQELSFTKRILDTFPTPNDKEKDSYVEIKLENGTIVYIRKFESQDDFWDVIHTLQNVILSGNDLFVSKKPLLVNNQVNESSSSLCYLDPLVSFEKNKQSYQKTKRKSTELTTCLESKTFINHDEADISYANEKTVYETKSTLNTFSTPVKRTYGHLKLNQNIHGSRYYERFTPADVAAFVRNIDPSFDNLAVRFFQEEIDGKALLLLTTDTLMRHMGLKLGPSLKIVHHIEQLKKF